MRFPPSDIGALRSMAFIGDMNISRGEGKFTIRKAPGGRFANTIIGIIFVPFTALSSIGALHQALDALRNASFLVLGAWAMFALLMGGCVWVSVMWLLAAKLDHRRLELVEATGEIAFYWGVDGAPDLRIIPSQIAGVAILKERFDLGELSEEDSFMLQLKLKDETTIFLCQSSRREQIETLAAVIQGHVLAREA